MKQPTAGQSAREYVSRYLRRRRALRIMRWAPLAAYVPLAYASVFSTLPGWALLVFLALFFLYLRAILFLLAMQYSLKDLILTRDCDGEKYLAVCTLLAPTIRRTTGMIAIDTAKARYSPAGSRRRTRPCRALRPRRQRQAYCWHTTMFFSTALWPPGALIKRVRCARTRPHCPLQSTKAWKRPLRASST